MSRRIFGSVGGYSCIQPISPRLDAIISGVTVATADIEYGILSLTQPCANIYSAPGQIIPDIPTGATPNGWV